jgi:hypothetical protein
MDKFRLGLAAGLAHPAETCVVGDPTARDTFGAPVIDGVVARYLEAVAQGSREGSAWRMVVS